MGSFYMLKQSYGGICMITVKNFHNPFSTIFFYFCDKWLILKNSVISAVNLQDRYYALSMKTRDIDVQISFTLQGGGLFLETPAL